jgi:hypothetical protein
MRMSVPPNASELARSGSVSQEASAKSIRTRSGLFGFFRPQKTVSPLTQQATQDLPVAKPRIPPQTFITEDEGHDSGIPAESGSAWSTLPEHLIESVMEMLQTEIPPPMHHSSKTSRQVCRLLLQSVALFSATQRLHLNLAFHLRFHVESWQSHSLKQQHVLFFADAVCYHLCVKELASDRQKGLL